MGTIMRVSLPVIRPFNCTRCGLCCRDVHLVPQVAHFDRGDGTCINLQAEADGTYTCLIYDARPDACRTDVGRPEAVSVDWWYRQSEAACRSLQENATRRRSPWEQSSPAFPLESAARRRDSSK